MPKPRPVGERAEAVELPEEWLESQSHTKEAEPESGARLAPEEFDKETQGPFLFYICY